MSSYVQALDHDPDYQAALATYDEVAQVRPQALAKLLPQVGVGGGVGRIEQSVSGTFFVGLLDDTRLGKLASGDGISSNRDEYFNRFGYGVGIQQALFHWNLFLGLSQADVKVAAAKVALLQAQNKLRLAVADAYFGVLSAQSQAQVAAAEHDALQQLAGQTADRFKAGLVSDAQNQQAAAAAQGAQAAVIAANAMVQVAKAQLTVVTGEPEGNLAPFNENVQLPAPEPDDVDSWVRHATTQNLGVGLAKLQLRIAQYGVRMARAQRLPTLDASATREYDYATGGITSGIGAGHNHALDQRIMLQLKMPIFSGGAILSAVRAAEAGVRRAQAVEDAKLAHAQADARIEFLKAEAHRAQLSALKQALVSSAAGEKAARIGYRVGTQTYVDVLTSVQQHYEVESHIAQTRYEYLLATLKLKDAAGSLSADDLQRINGWLQ
ncbi:MAG TPA: TolC family outer membrane protein [Nevskiaceae bacterium]|nr:TolC family outer membrane protein [Nevskiaceae bacterium]